MTGAPEWGRYAGVITRLEAGEKAISRATARLLHQVPNLSEAAK
jgi:hypothetical protein